MFSCATGRTSLGLKNEFELSMVNEQSVLESSSYGGSNHLWSVTSLVWREDLIKKIPRVIFQSYIFNLFQDKKRPFQSQQNSVSYLHLRSEHCQGIILFGYLYEENMQICMYIYIITSVSQLSSASCWSCHWKIMRKKCFIKYREWWLNLYVQVLKESAKCNYWGQWGNI